MSTEEKLAIIQAEFDRLYDPSHLVRNHLETLDSIEEIRIIKEALQ
jgi:response regulator RpfG family c-di-GMP phosphodiesterase